MEPLDNVNNHLDPITLEPLTMAVKVNCGGSHLYNQETAQELIARAHGSAQCSLCRRQFQPGHLIWLSVRLCAELKVNLL